MKKTIITLSPDLYFSYSQFYIYDESIQMPACDWTASHSAQGFARREGTVAFGTLLEFGTSKVIVKTTAYHPCDRYQRVIAVPFAVVAGKVIVDGPEETENGRERNFSLPLGNYRLVVAQSVLSDAEEAIELFFEPLTQPMEKSVILVADGALNPFMPLIETSGIPGIEAQP